MAIHILPEPDVYLTQSEYNLLRAEYDQAFSFYAGTPPTFNEWVAQRHGGIRRSSINGNGDER